MLKSRNVIQPAKPPQHTNQQLIPIYTDWANRYLTKYGRTPIHDLTEDLRDPKTLVNLVDAVTLGCPGTSQTTLLCSLNAPTPIECIEKCLHYLAGLGVNVANLKAQDLNQGHLGEILALLFALSHYKQLHRQNTEGCVQASPKHLKGPGLEGSKIAKVTVSAKAVTQSTMKIPTPAGRKSSLAKPETGIQKPANGPVSKACGSKLIVPSSIAKKVQTPTTAQTEPKQPEATTKLAPPRSRLSAPPPPATTTASSRLKPPVKASSSRITSAHGSTNNLATSNLSSTSTTSTTSASSTLATANGHAGSNLKGPSFLRHRSSSATVSKEIPLTVKPSVKKTTEVKILKSGGQKLKSAPSVESVRVPLTQSGTGLKGQAGQSSGLKLHKGNSKLGSHTALSAPQSTAVPISGQNLVSQQPDQKVVTKVSDSKLAPLVTNTKPVPAVPDDKLLTKKQEEKQIPLETQSENKLVPPSSKPGSITKLKRPTEGSSPSKMMSFFGKGRKSETSKKTVAEETNTPQKTDPASGTALFTKPKPPQVPEKKSKLAVTKADSDIRADPASEDSAYGSTITNNPSPRSSLSNNSSTHSSTSSLATFHKPTSIPASVLPETIPEVPSCTNVSDRTTNINVDRWRDQSLDRRIDQSLERRADHSLERRADHSLERKIDLGPKLVDDSGISSDATNPYDTVVKNCQDGKPTLAVKGFMARNRSEEPKISEERVSEGRELKSEADGLRPVTKIGVIHSLVNHDQKPLKTPKSGRKLHKTEGLDSDLQDMPVPPPPLRLTSDLTLLCNNKQEPSVIKFEAMQSQVDNAKTIRRVMRLAYRHRERHDSFEDSSSISSGLSENLDDVSTDDLTGSSLSDHNMTAATSSVPSRGQILPRASKASNFENAQREQQRKLVEQQQSVVEELLQKSRSSQRGLAFQNSVQSTSTTDFGRVYHTLHGAAPTLSAAQRVPHVQLSADGDSLHIRSHNNTPNFGTQTSSVHYNCHSLDRQGHLKTYLEPQRHQIQQSAYSEIGRPTDPYMMNMTHRNSDRSHQARSSSVSAMNCPSQMSRSMVFYESDTNINKINNNSRQLTSRERLYAEMMAAVSSPRSTTSRSLSRASPRPSRAYFSLANERPNRNGSLSARLPGPDYGSRNNLRLHKLGAELHCSPRSQPTFVRLNSQCTGSQISLSHRSESPYANFDHQQELHRLNDEMNSYCRNLYNQDHTLQQFEAGLESIKLQVQKVCKKNPSQAEALMQRIEELKALSIDLTRRDSSLKRHPSVESVQSYASVNSKRNVDKNGMLTKTGKKSWIRSSFSRAFKGKKQKSEDKGSTTKLNEADDDIHQLKMELEEKDRQLGDVRLEALDKSRELDMLRETVSRLKNENKALKHTTVLLERRAVRTESRASSRQSLSTCCHEEEQLENSSIPERSCSSSTSSKRSSGGLNARVVVEMDTSGSMEFGAQQELNIGTLSVVTPTTTWNDVDRCLNSMIDDYMRRIDPGQKLGLVGQNCLIGYQVGYHKGQVGGHEQHLQLPNRAKNDSPQISPKLGQDMKGDQLNGLKLDYQQDQEGTADNIRNIILDTYPKSSPHELITPSVIVKLKLKGAAQNDMDSLVIESLFPKETLHKLLSLLLKSRRLVINGPTGIGKSNLSRFLAKYLASQQNIQLDNVHDFNFPINDYEKQSASAKKELEQLLRSGEDAIVRIDNTPRKAVDVLCSAFATADEFFNGKSRGPYVIITLNKTSDIQLNDLQVNYNVHFFSLYCQMEPVKGYLARYLRRRIAQEELTGYCKCGEQLQTVIDFLTQTLQIVNDFIKDVNSLDTIGPRIFLRCPLQMDQSRVWFIRLWNTNIIPYLAKVVRENDATLESDPTPLVNERWPWLDGVGGECELKTIREEMRKGNNSYSGSQASAIDAIYALDLFQEKRNGKSQLQTVGVL
ncbi:unnamed protein product [Bursaphelenchus okinawaensis]|uniref:Calponin-homology (CH) domain-containing protein n=1 Tax=Bursaphelenchus okinawaensis TaxID=465554 RepID=A0A811K3T1_9BILA|nr:unnamed protein product [Bursaphelenchus okinawaensis]CAG9090759.1 unnamed protein product [Bursaphelenchus okinawaensis]